ncbi:hypothetical protein [Ornithinimicrobium sp. W1665]|uniref:hypothetical protein n=1 Tax=Ornithinimicrobium sp. W1665 TaxID=3416666 RepID=UPI003D6B9CDF
MTTAPTPRTRRGAVLLTAAAVGAVALSGCSVTNDPTTTTLRYAPADGVELDGETVDVRDLFVVSQGSGAPGVVSGSVVNSGAEPATVTVAVAGQQVGSEVTVEPGQAVRLDGVQPDGSEGERLVVEAVDAVAGQLVEVRIQTAEETLTAEAPVLLPRGPYEQYADDAGGTVEPPQGDEGDADH